MKLALTHTLSLRLGTPVRALQHLLLTALPTPQQKVERWSIDMPGIADSAVLRDGFGNRAHLVSQSRPGTEIVVRVDGLVETFDRAGVLGRLEHDPRPAVYRRATALTARDDALLQKLSPAATGIARLHDLMGILSEMEPAQQTQGADGQQQSQQSGTERAAAELAHAFIGAARALDIPARHVTGYLYDDGEASFHAWAEAWDDGLGWVGFDPTLNVCPADRHIRLASGFDAFGTMPIRAVPAWTEMLTETITISEGWPGS